MIFGYEFNSDAEMPEQMQLYFEQLDEEDGVPTEAEVTYIRDKALNVILKTEEIDEMLNANTKGWKTGRMNKVDLSILRLAVYEMKWDDEIPAGVAIDQAVELAKKGLAISQKRYEIGNGTILELNNSQVSLTNMQLTYNNSIYDYLVAQSELKTVLGEE